MMLPALALPERAAPSLVLRREVTPRLGRQKIQTAPRARRAAPPGTKNFVHASGPLREAEAVLTYLDCWVPRPLRGPAGQRGDAANRDMGS